MACRRRVALLSSNAVKGLTDRLIVSPMTPIPPSTSTLPLAIDPAAGLSGARPMADNGSSNMAATADGLPPAGSGVIDAAGEFGTVVVHHGLADTGSAGLSSMVAVRHREQQVLLPSGLFEAVSATSFRIPLSFSALISGSGDGSNGNLVIPVLQEEMSVATRLVDSGRGVRIHKQIVETPHLVERPLLQDRLVVEHVAIDRLLDDAEMPQSRQEGDVLIVPVIEEVLVVQTRRRLKEEIRITRSSELVHQQQTVMLKSEQVSIERFDDRDAPLSAHGNSSAEAVRTAPPAPDESGTVGTTQSDVPTGGRLSF